MSEDKKDPDKTDPFSENQWKHDKELSFNRVTGHVLHLKEAVDKAIEYERMKLSRMAGVKDLIRKPKTNV